MSSAGAKTPLIASLRSVYFSKKEKKLERGGINNLLFWAVTGRSATYATASLIFVEREIESEREREIESEREREEESGLLRFPWGGGFRRPSVSSAGAERHLLRRSGVYIF